jgi:HAE1 family hydrophobic/amphiphilic exporter-1
LVHPVAKTRLLGNAFLFALVFPFAAFIGYEYKQWKGEEVFKFAFMPPSDGGAVSVSLMLQPGSALSETEKVVARVEDVVEKHPDVKYVLSDVGERSGGGWSGSESGTNYGQVRATLYHKAAPLDKMMFWVPRKERFRARSDSDVAADLVQQLGRIPGVEMTVAAAGGQGFGAPIQMSFSSDDRQLLFDTASKIVAGLKSGAIKGVISPEMSSKPGKPEIRAIPDRARLADVDMTAAEVANTMRVLYEGDDQAKLRLKGREYDIRVMMDPTDRNNPKIVEQLPLKFVEGSPVFLSQVATLSPGVGVSKIERRDRTEEIKVTSDLLPGFAAGSVQLEIDKWLEKEKIVPEGVRIKPLGQADVQAREMGYLFGALGIALVLVYLLLASLYNNWLYPFVIQLAQPQAMVGALLALVIFDKTLNIVGMVGIIALVGLVGKNAILLVDYTNTLRARGRERREALLEAGPTRLRPIMMTTLALILGMLPVALAIGRGSEFRETIGYTIIGGISLSTLLTLLVIPCSYTIFDDFSDWWMGKVRGAQAWLGRGRHMAPASQTIGPEPNGEVDGAASSFPASERPGAPAQGE